jgi:serine/threonine protein kinase
MLNWYRIERILGRGGFGVIYLATDTNLDHQVAIKEYIPSDVATRSGDSRVHPITEDHSRLFRWGMERFIKEARNLVKFKHPNIVRVMSIFQENNTAYMVMEFEEGEELRSYLKRAEANTEHNLKALILPISQGLAEVHRHGFVHRDIKPANILVRKNGSPVLLDFGSARNASRFTQQQNMTALVSAGYAPLEQYNGEGEEEQQGPWTDIYALGGVLYYAISGNDPIDSTRRGAAMINGGQDPMIPAIKLGQTRYSDAFLSAIDWALRFRIADRPQTLADWVPALLGDRTVDDYQQTTHEWIDKQGLGATATQLDRATVAKMSEATVLSRDRNEQMQGSVERPVPESRRPRQRTLRPFAWMTIALMIGACVAWVSREKPELFQGVLASLYQDESRRSEIAAAKLAEQEAQSKKLAEEAQKAAAARAEAARLKADEEAAQKLAEQEAAQLKAEEAAAKLLAEQEAAQRLALEEAERRLADEEATRKLAEAAAEQEKRRQEARLTRRLNSALSNASIALTQGDVDKAQREVNIARGIGLIDRRIPEIEERLRLAIAEHNKPVSDDDFDIVMRMFDALKRSIESKDIASMDRLTKQSDQTELFTSLIARFEKIEVEILGIKVRNADKTISAQLEIKSMVRANGDRATPSDAYRIRTIKSKRINSRWSVIDW